MAISNRTFDGRKGRGGRPPLLPPPMAVEAAITWLLMNVSELK